MYGVYCVQIVPLYVFYNRSEANPIGQQQEVFFIGEEKKRKKKNEGFCANLSGSLPSLISRSFGNRPLEGTCRARRTHTQKKGGPLERE